MSTQAELVVGEVAGKVAGLILAAGGSTRMGAAQNKLIMRVDESPLIVWPVDAMQGAGIRSLRVVTGFESEAVESALSGRDCKFSYHANWAEGMGASLAFGVRQILAEEEHGGARQDALLLCLGDLPGLRASMVKSVFAGASLDALKEQVVIPVFDGRRGHPVLFGRAFWPELTALSGDEGAKGIVAAAGDRVVEIEVENHAIHADLDTPSDLAAWQTRKR